MIFQSGFISFDHLMFTSDIIKIMRQVELDLIQDISLLEKDQKYLLQQPQNPQQSFLHLFGHRHLISKTIFNKNLDRIVDQLPGTFAQSALQLNYSSFLIQNNISQGNSNSALFETIQSWIDYYPTVRKKGLFMLCDIIFQQQTAEIFNGWNHYVTYLNLISLDLWKIIRRGKKQDLFLQERPFRDQLKQISQQNFSKFDANDILTFISSCLVKTLANIILQKDALPQQISKKNPKFQCLFSNQQAEYFLRINSRLAMLIKQLLMVLINFELTKEQQKYMMLLIMRFYQTFHPFRQLNTSEMFIFGFNAIENSVRQTIKDELAMFLRAITKLQKVKFLKYLKQNSKFFTEIISKISQNTMIGYFQEALSPYSTIQLGQSITVQAGKSQSRFFQILQPWSLFYLQVLIQSQDINLKLYYLGDITAQKTTRKLLFSQDKISGQFKSCFNAIKRGLYQFQFDNSYSWLNSKNIVYQNLVYAPLQIQTKNAFKWSFDFYQDILQNEIVKDQNISFLKQQQKPQKSQERSQQNSSVGIAYVSKLNEIFSLRLRNQNKSQMLYETDNSQRMQQRLKEVYASRIKYRWSLMNYVVNDFSQIDDFVRGIQSDKQKQYQHVSTIEKEIWGTEQDEDQVEYEVVQKRSNGKKQVTRTHKETKKSKAVKENKEQISWSTEQTANFYEEDK